MSDIPKPIIAAPYEAVIVAALELAKTIIAGQPADVRERLWRMHVEDLEKWRSFIERIGGIFKKEDK